MDNERETNEAPAKREMSDLMKAHLDAIAGGAAAHSSWRSAPDLPDPIRTAG
jgi:hypothetical protein